MVSFPSSQVPASAAVLSAGGRGSGGTEAQAGGQAAVPPAGPPLPRGLLHWVQDPLPLSLCPGASPQAQPSFSPSVISAPTPTPHKVLPSSYSQEGHPGSCCGRLRQPEAANHCRAPEPLPH